MKRREFLLTSASLTALSFLPNISRSSVFIAKKKFVSEAYDDNQVVRVYDRSVTNYNFSGEPVYWKTINKDVLKGMLTKAIFQVSGEKNEAKAWKKILTGIKMDDLSQKKIIVKVNFNNTIRDIHTTLNNSPAMMVVLTKSLIEAGVREENICFFDCSRPFPDEFKAEVRLNNLALVRMMGKNDNLVESDKKIFLSDNKGMVRDGKPIDKYPIPQCIIDADYLVNLHLVKIHSTGVTGAMKNLFGISSNVALYMHDSATKNFPESNQLPDLSLNEEIKKRARLNIAEFVFGGHTPDTLDQFTSEDFFPGGIPASIIVSRCPFYHDTVLYGFIRAEYQTCIPVLKRFQKIGPDLWLKNSSERFAGWKYDQAEFINANKEGHPKKDLSFKQVNYVSI